MDSEHSSRSDSLASGFSIERGALKPPERSPAALSHLLSLPPLWGVIFASGVLFYYRESSRAVAFQARQAINLHLAFLAVGLAGLLARLLFALLETAFPGHGLADAAAWFDESKAAALYIAYCFIETLAAAMCAMGHRTVYPLLGRRLWQAPDPKTGDDLYG